MNICNNQTFSKLLFLFAIFVVLNLLYIKSNRQIDFVTNSIFAASVTQDDTIKQNISIGAISTKIQTRIHSLQNPSDCVNNRVIIFNAELWQCGFGCSIHQMAPYLHLAFVTNRTLIVKNSPNLRFFEPLVSQNCIHWHEKNLKLNGDDFLNIFFLYCWSHLVYFLFKDSVDYINDRIINIDSKALHLATQEYSNNLLTNSSSMYKDLHKQSLAFLNGQFINYFMRPNDNFQKRLKEFMIEKKFLSSCAGIHVRRTDKQLEANHTELSEYMNKIDEYFSRLPDLKSRCVFIATDEIKVVDEAKEK